MKCLIAISSSISGGAQRHVSDLVSALQRKNIDVAVVCPRGYLNTSLLALKSIKVYTLSFDFLSLSGLVRTIREEKPDIIHMHLLGAGLWGTIASLIAKRGRRIFTIHNSIIYPGMKLWKKLVYTRIHKFIASRAFRVIAVSKDIRSFLTEQLDVPENKALVVNNWVEPHNFDLNSVQPGKIRSRLDELRTGGNFVIGVMGRLSMLKGHVYLLESLKILLPVISEIRVVVLGDGEMRNELEDIVKRSGLEDKVIFAGHLYEPFRVFRYFDVMVFPSISEGFPIAHLEAAGYGLAVIATKVGSVDEIIINNKTGILVPPKSPEKIAEAIKLLYNNPQKRAELARNAKDHIKTFYNAEAGIAKILESYEPRINI
jgi:glycosyltransferase involved in cell wall biosynthesis